MKYKDYYAILGLERTAELDDVKKAYRKLARKFHPDISKDPDGEEKFKEIAEAYQTLKDPERRDAYDRLGRHAAGEDFQPSRDWGTEFSTQFGDGAGAFEGVDLADLFAHLSRGQGVRAGRAVDGADYEVAASISLEDAFSGTTVTLNLSVPVHDEHGRTRREPRTLAARVPKGATDGQRLRLRGQGSKGLNGGRDGDLYLTLKLIPHRLYRADGHDLYQDLPITAWEAALGAKIELPTLAGAVNLVVPPATSSGQSLRLAGRGLPKPAGGAGDLFALVKIVMPPNHSEQEMALFQQLALLATFNPRPHLEQENAHAD